MYRSDEDPHRWLQNYYYGDTKVFNAEVLGIYGLPDDDGKLVMDTYMRGENFDFAEHLPLRGEDDQWMVFHYKNGFRVAHRYIVEWRWTFTEYQWLVFRNKNLPKTATWK